MLIWLSLLGKLSNYELAFYDTSQQLGCLGGHSSLQRDGDCLGGGGAQREPQSDSCAFVGSGSYLPSGNRARVLSLFRPQP